jgi:hypothetical protein
MDIVWLVILAVGVWLVVSIIVVGNDRRRKKRKERMDDLRIASMIRERLEQVARDDAEARGQAENWMPPPFWSAKPRTSRPGAPRS